MRDGAKSAALVKRDFSLSRKGAKAQRKEQDQRTYCIHLKEHLLHFPFEASFLCAFAPLREPSETP